ncbi:MAG: homocysteine S-methyltransferase family protein, partial [Chloroflexales bacterium]|nr:homocysteine S-methyltransferase family protein [Chloroflexales bacterium]
MTITPPRPARHSRYLTALGERVLIYDGAMGTSLFDRNLTAADYGGEATYGCHDYLVLTRPDVIADIHRSFFAAGCDVVETDSFQASRLRLEEWGLGERTYEINREAARLARAAADEFEALDGRPRFVAGSIGPTGKLPSSDDPVLSNVTFDQLSDVFCEQARALIEGGADVLLTETNIDLIELKAAVDGIRRAREAMGRHDVALQSQVVIELSGRMLFGAEVSAVIAAVEALGVDVIGMNCSTGPEHMRDAIRYFTGHTRLPISCIPNAGLPLNVDGETVYPMEPEPFARILGDYVREFGVGVVGGCCGTRPAHIAALRATVGYDTPHKQRDIDDAPHVASGMGAQALHQNPRPLIIGERVNSLGSRKVKKLLLNDDYDAIVDIARDQVESGAHTLDVCVASTERSDEMAQMVALTRKLSMSIDAPLVFDSTEADVLEAALKVYPGRAILNSTSLEGGRGKKIDQTLPLAVRYGAAVVAIAIDEEGMAHTPEEKLRTCRRIYEIATQEYGLPPHALIFDVNVFPITTGQADLRDEGAWTIEGVRLVKQHLPGALTSLGVSNLSFGVAPHARAALNSVFLFHAVQAGLDLAMVNPAHITPYAEVPADERALCEDLIFNRREDALTRFIQHFDTTTASAEKDERADPTEGMSVDQKIHYQILHRKKDGIEALLDAALASRRGAGVEQGVAAVDVLNAVLLPAMKDVGDRFGAGELILPFVLQSAEVMKRAVAHLEQFLDKQEGVSKGRVVLATVYGDVHDIGKSLVNTILSNNGYTVYDLGKQVPLSTIIEKAQEYKADAIGLSALLVSTSKQMPLCVKELDRLGIQIPVLVGG